MDDSGIIKQEKGAYTMNNQAVISAKHLKKSFGTKENVQTIYSDLNIDIYEGDFTVIMGLYSGRFI